jgi:hypothetical protein
MRENMGTTEKSMANQAAARLKWLMRQARIATVRCTPVLNRARSNPLFENSLA